MGSTPISRSKIMNSSYQQLIDEIDNRLSTLGFVDSEFELDHAGYKCSSMDDYNAKKSESLIDSNLIHEGEVRGKMVGIFQFKTPMAYKNHTILGFEVVSPAVDEKSESYWEHVEYVVPGTLQELVNKHLSVNWDKSALDKPLFSKVAIRFEDGLSAKFHTESVLDEVKKF